MNSVEKSCQNCVSCVDDKCINVYNESGRIDMFDASHCTRWKDKNNLQVSSVIPELEITLSIKQYDNKASEFIQALSELTDMYGNYISEANIDDCLNLVKKKGKLVFDSLEYGKFKEKGEKIIHWLPKENVLKIEVLMPDNKLVKGVGESNMNKIKEGEIVQAERYGFLRCDKKEKNKLLFWYTHR